MLLLMNISQSYWLHESHYLMEICVYGYKIYDGSDISI